MQGRVATASNDMLAEIAGRPDTTVMKAVHDNTYDPWDVDVVEEIVEALSKLSSNLDGASLSETREVARTSPEMPPRTAEFAEQHPLLFEKLCDPKVTQNPEHMRVIKFMLVTQRQLQNNSISESDAAAKVSDVALRACTNVET